MSTRERIIVIMAVIAVIYAVISFLPEKEKKFFNNTFEQTDDEINMNVNRINRLLTDGKISNAELLVLSRSNSKWHDSFITTQDDKPLPIPSIDPVPKYSGYLSIGDKTYAILDGNEYQPGEKLESSDYVVEEILPDNVIIRKNNKKEIIVKIEEAE